MNEKVSVLICDDSALMRNLIGRIVENSETLELAGKAMNGRFLLDKIPKLDPDVIILDLEMPEMNGIEFLKERKRLGIDIPVVILSSIARRGARITMEALDLGASDFILKPTGTASEDIQKVAVHIVDTVFAYGSKYQRQRKTPRHIKPLYEYHPPQPVIQPFAERKPQPVLYKMAPPKTGKDRPPHGRIELCVIGISTGGPNALRIVLPKINPNIDIPFVIVQHMPAGFTLEFAHSLDRICPLEIKEAADGDIAKPGRILIAPGDAHVVVERRPLATIVRLDRGDPVNGHKPSADVLFKSAAREFGHNCLAVIMTGMGKDGAREIGSIYNCGGTTLGQDENTCVVYGMPKVAIENGYIDHVLPLEDIADMINSLVYESRN